MVQQGVGLGSRAAQAAARAIAERLLRGVSATTVSVRGHSVRLACSIGGATTYPSNSSQRAEFLQVADQALYTAKQQGRNRVVVAAAA